MVRIPLLPERGKIGHGYKGGKDVRELMATVGGLWFKSTVTVDVNPYRSQDPDLLQRHLTVMVEVMFSDERTITIPVKDPVRSGDRLTYTINIDQAIMGHQVFRVTVLVAYEDDRR